MSTRSGAPLRQPRVGSTSHHHRSSATKDGVPWCSWQPHRRSRRGPTAPSLVGRGGGGIRTLTGDGLSALPLPVGLRPLSAPFLTQPGLIRRMAPWSCLRRRRPDGSRHLCRWIPARHLLTPSRPGAGVGTSPSHTRPTARGLVDGHLRRSARAVPVPTRRRPEAAVPTRAGKIHRSATGPPR